MIRISIRLCFAAVAILFLGSNLLAEKTPGVRVFETRALCNDANVVLTIGGFEVVHDPAMRYEVYFNLRLDHEHSLIGADHRELQKRWGEVFTPEEKIAHFTQCRDSFTFDEISKATNLPKGQRTMIYAVCDVYDPAAKAYVGLGWNVASPMYVTTDVDGRVTRIDPLMTGVARASANHPAGKIAAKRCELTAAHLTLKPSAAIYRAAIEVNGSAETCVANDDEQAELHHGDYLGGFFGPIDSPEKAMELISLKHYNGFVIKTPEQYAAIVNALKTVPGFPNVYILLDKADHFGMEVEAVPGVGYKIGILVAFRAGGGGWDVEYLNYIITTDGRINAFETTRQIDIPGDGQSVLGNAPAGSIDKAFRSAFAATGVEMLPQLFKVTDTRVTIPCRADTSAERYISDYAKWTPDASK